MNKEEAKAKELYNKFLLPITQRYIEQGQYIGNAERSLAKQCAIICVTELINDCDPDSPYDTNRKQFWQSILTHLKNI